MLTVQLEDITVEIKDSSSSIQRKKNFLNKQSIRLSSTHVSKIPKERRKRIRNIDKFSKFGGGEL